MQYHMSDLFQNRLGSRVMRAKSAKVKQVETAASIR
jgi:hypothetical protein